MYVKFPFEKFVAFYKLLWNQPIFIHSAMVHIVDNMK